MDKDQQKMAKQVCLVGRLALAWETLISLDLLTKTSPDLNQRNYKIFLNFLLVQITYSKTLRTCCQEGSDP
jgi:hypothetical protein